jgi:O-antigen ligase
VRRACALLLALLIAVPLLPDGGSTDAFRRPAVLALGAALAAIGAAWAAKVRTRRTDRNPLGTAAVVLVAVHALSGAVGGATLEPLLALACGLAAFAAARRGPLPDGFSGDVAPKVVCAVAALLGAWGAVQAASGAPATAGEGNTNYSGTLAALLLPAAMGVLLGPGRRAWGAAGVLGALVLLALSRSRAGWAGAGAGCLVAVLLARLAGAPGAFRLGGAVLAAVALLPLAVPGPGPLDPGRLETGLVRAGLWRGALRIAAEHPVLGAGPGRFAVEYPRHRSAEEFRVSQTHVRRGEFKEAEDAHSSWLQAAAETGAAGVLAWLLLFWVVARRGIAHARAGRGGAWVAGVTGTAAAMAAAGLFNALTLHASHQVVFWALLGLGDRRGMEGLPERRRDAGTAFVALRAGASVLLAGLAWIALELAARDRGFVAAMALREPALRAGALEALDAGLPGAWRTRYELGRTYDALRRPAEAVEAYAAALAERPHHAASLNNLGVALISARGDRARARSALERAAELAPGWFFPAYNLGGMALQDGDLVAAAARLERASGLDPDHAGARFSLGEARYRSGRKEAAVEEFRRAAALGLDVAAALTQEHSGWLADPLLAEWSR